MNTNFRSTTPQVGPATATAPAMPATTPAPAIATAPQPNLRFGPDGKIQGLDGVLSQIADSLGKVVTPLVRDTALPIIQRDKALQREIGASAGKAAAQEASLWLALMGLGLSGIAIAMLWNAWQASHKTRTNPSRRRHRRNK